MTGIGAARDIRAALAELGIAYNLSGGNISAKCPECSPTRKHKNAKSLSVKSDGTGLLYNCHNCGFKGKWSPERGTEGRKPYRKPKLPEYAAMQDALGPAAIAYLQSRRIPAKTARECGLYVSRDDYKGWLAFPYTADGEVVMVKYRSFPEKKPMGRTVDCRSIFYGLDWLAETEKGGGFGEIVVVEGEFDALAVKACGWANVLSVPNGGGNKDMTAVISHAVPWLEKASGFILALDDDEQGRLMAETLSGRLGRHRCKTARFAYKDANETLAHLGADEVLNALQEAECLPIAGVWNTAELNARVKELFRNGFKPGLSTGFPDLDRFYTVAERGLTVLTGYPNNGKSEFMDMLAFNLWRNNGWKFAIFSPENDSAAQQLRYNEKLVGKPASEKYPDRMTAEENDAATDEIGSGFKFFRFDGDDEPCIRAVLERAEGCVMRDGIRGLIIDPFNEISQERKQGDSETDYVSKMLSEVKKFYRRYNVHVFFIAHPKKPERAGTDNQPPPGLFSIAGSQHWANKADYGLTVERMESGDVTIHVTKVRDKNHGKKGSATLKYDIATGIYSEKTGPDFSLY